MTSAPSAPPAAAPKPWLALTFAAATVGLLVVYPPFHVVSRSAPPTAAAPATFDPVAFADRFWASQLQPAASRAPDVAPLLAELQRDPAAARRNHARQVGLGSAAYYFIQGSGRVTAVERNRLLLDVNGSPVALRTGPVFGNTVRDGCALLEVNQAPGLAEFNALSAELNKLVEERVQPTLKSGVAVGALVTFAGTAEAPETLPATGAPLLTVIPLQAEVKP